VFAGLSCEFFGRFEGLDYRLDGFRVNFVPKGNYSAACREFAWSLGLKPEAEEVERAN